MIVAALATVLILAIAYYQVAQGVFSALITAILSVLCAVLALNTYEALGGAVLYARQGAYADPIALTALFVIPLLALRILFDKLVSGNVACGTWADRIGGGALGLVTGMVMVGMLLIIVQLLPFGETAFGFRSYDEKLQRDQRITPLYPDEFTVALAKLASGGAFSSDTSFEKHHDDLLLEAFASRNTADKNGGLHAAPGAVTVQRAYEPGPKDANWVADVPEDPALPDAGPTKVVALRVAVDGAAADTDRWFRLAGTQFRLVAKPAPRSAAGEPGVAEAEPADLDISPAGRSCFPLGYLKLNTDRTQWVFHGAPLTKPKVRGEKKLLQPGLLIIEQSPAASATVYWVYRLREGERPDYLAFRRVALSEIPRVVKASPAVPKPAEKKPSAKKAPKTDTKKTSKTKKSSSKKR